MVAEVEQSTELSVQDAAHLAGVSERAVRNWVRDGKLPATPSEQGKRIQHSALLHFLQERQRQFAGPLAEVAERGPVPSEPTPIRRPVTPEAAPERIPAPAEPQSDPAAPALVALVEKLHKENVELAGRIGYYQAKVQQYEERILLLEAPKDSTPELTPAPERLPWYKRLFALE